ncbi:hypothetical protein K503DRAFT_786669 [Rhizopogon vinicolor AM-OR11-026]|uniref:Uncharacterized protein n=1 Tax=Rhizopogon vinicolor AM-OR11-026 TaxID=1314800 RepID=A0A1B7MKR6_9AGAM|nr:hypothetical protein K503DRAFT_786669 [Rhizopogon vinicolor AM-OR11-026]
MLPLSSSSLRRTGTPDYNRDLNASYTSSGWSSFAHAALATALFRCWHILIFFGAWSTVICVISHNVYNLALQPTLITVFGTVLGFVISYRTTSSFERYNEGRRLWAQIVLGSRTFARTVWLHVPDDVYPLKPPTGEQTGDEQKEENKAKTLVEKKSVVNLLEAFAVAVKHYLRGEDSIFYEDLYHLVKFLPAYALPPTIPSVVDLNEKRDSSGEEGPCNFLLPAMIPPKHSFFHLFPFSVRMPTGVDVRKETEARQRAMIPYHRGGSSYNIPLEISLYLSSYISALQLRKTVDVPTINLLLGTLGQLVDALTGLERILTTPLPFSYCIHLWLVTLVYCLALPFQVWSSLKWLTIPATVLASFIFFGFLVAGEEIENPFGYDKNDLNMDYFVHDIIRKELRAITAMPMPDPGEWAFSSQNDFLFANSDQDERIQPSEWVRRGVPKMRDSLKVQ